MALRRSAVAALRYSPLLHTVVTAHRSGDVQQGGGRWYGGKNARHTAPSCLLTNRRSPSGQGRAFIIITASIAALIDRSCCQPKGGGRGSISDYVVF